jgi:peptidoglycan/xylan/chitin deacetylase (PgdA/CDA1 family)
MADSDPAAADRAAVFAPPPRRAPRWPRVLGLLLMAILIGGAVGLTVPINGQMGWQLLADNDFCLPVVFPWSGRGTIDPAVARLVQDSPWFAPRARPTVGWQRPRYGSFDLFPEAINYARPRRSDLRRALCPHLGDDPLALSAAAAWAVLHVRLAPAEISAVAKAAVVPVVCWHDVVDGPKLVDFDLKLADFERQLDAIAAAGCQPISLHQWWKYITRGDTLPPKPILLTFDDGYESAYRLIYPQLKKRGWPAVFFIVADTVGRKIWSKDHVTWEQCREMAATGLYEVQCHSLTHPHLPDVSETQLHKEVFDARDILERHLGRPTQFFCYPMGKYNQRVIEMLKEAGFVAGFASGRGGSGQSRGIYEILRYDQGELAQAIEDSDAGPLRQPDNPTPAATAPAAAPLNQGEAGAVTFRRESLGTGAAAVPMCWCVGGRAATVHCDYRYAVGDVARLARAAAAINGGFFQLARIKDISNAMMGPVLSQLTTTRDNETWRRTEIGLPLAVLPYGRFIPGEPSDTVRLVGRPLVLIGPSGLRFVDFSPAVNSLAEVQALMPDVTDAFVGGGWLVRDGRALDRAGLDRWATHDHNDFRRRAWFGVLKDGRPALGASPSSQRSETIARGLQQIGLQQAVLLDSGFSTSLFYAGQLYVTGHSDEQPSRPVPHMILLFGSVDQAAAAANPPDERNLDTDPGAAANSRRQRR